MTYRQERAIAIRNYKHLVSMAKQSENNRQWHMVSLYKHEAAELKLQYNL